MKARVERVDLSYAVNAVAKALPGSMADEKQRGITIDAKNDKLYFEASNGELVIGIAIKAEVDQEGAANVPGKLLIETVKKMQDDFIGLELQGTRLSVEYEKGAVQLPVLAPVPLSSDKENTYKWFEISNADFKKVIQKTQASCAKDNTRPILKGIRLKTIGEKLEAASLDGYRLSLCSVGITPKDGGDKEIVVPLYTMKTISDLISKDDEKMDLMLSKNGHKLIVKQNDITIMSVLYTGQYIDPNNIIPKSFATKTTMSKTECLQSIERALIFANSDKNKLCVFNIESDCVTITATDESGGLLDTIDAEVEGKPVKIAFNSMYLIDALKCIDKDKFTLEMVGKIQPAVIRDDDCLFMVLPVRTGN